MKQKIYEWQISIIFILTCAFLLISNTSKAQNSEFRNITTSNGLNNGSINSITPHTDGPVWFATWDGLIRFDGYKFKTYFPEIDDSTSLQAKKCIVSFLDSDNELWISTKAGVSKYNSELDNFSQFILPSVGISRTVGDKFVEFRDYLFVSSFHGIYYHFLDDDIKQTSNEFRQLEVLGIDGNSINNSFRNFSCISERFIFSQTSRSQDGRIQTQISFARFENLYDSLIQLRVYDEIIIRGLVQCFEEKDESSIYIGTNRGVVEYNTDTQRLVYNRYLRGFMVNTLYLDSNENLWIGTGQSGLMKYSKGGQVTKFVHDPNIQNSICGNNILSITEDFSKNLWVGMDGQGVSVLSLIDKGFNSYHYEPGDPFSLKDNTVFCFSETQDEILIGTKEAGLLSVKIEDLKNNVKFRSIDIPYLKKDEKIIRSIWEIQKENDSIYWFGTNYGLIRGEKLNSNWEFKHYLSDQRTGIVREIFVDDDGNLLVGAYKGLFILPADSRDMGEVLHLKKELGDTTSLSDNTITSFLIDKNDNLWIGTQNGGVNKLIGKYSDINFDSLRSSEFKFEHFVATTKTDSWIKTNEINCLFEYYDGSIWAGTQGAGINILHYESMKTEVLNVSSGLSGRDVFGILSAQDGDLWISTNQGLSKFDPLEDKFTIYSPSDGIQGNVFMVNSFFKASNNYLYFGGRNGFTRFSPSTIRQNNIPPEIFLTDLQIYQQKVEIGEKVNGNIILDKALNNTDNVILSYKDSDLSIHFAAIHFADPDENIVEYMLEGFDNDFAKIPAKQGFIRYTNLNQGDYNLKLRAGNSDAIWMENYRELKIKVLPPWWKTIFARIIFILLLIFFFGGITYLMVHRERLKYSLSIEKIEKKKLTELNESKLRFFTNISHEFRTPLTLILAPLETSLAKVLNKDYFLSKQLKLAMRNVDVLLRLVNQVINFRQIETGKAHLKLEVGDLDKFLREIIISFEPILKEKKINLDISFPELKTKMCYDPDKIEQIMHNLLSNAFKYTFEGGNILISCKLEDIDIPEEEKKGEYYCIHVFNDGAEIPEEKQDKIFERFYTLSENSMGSGIGLGLTKSMVELHNGFMNLESGVGKGNTFSIYIPTKLHLLENVLRKEAEYVEAVPDKNILSNKEDLEFTNESDISKENKERLLFIDDNSELRNFFKSSFSDQFEVHEAENGKVGVSLTNELIPDIVVCDISMPEMDGVEYCNIVKDELTTSHIPVILLTAKDSPESKISGYKAGADAYVVKPFRIDVLKAHIDQLLKNRDKIRENYKTSDFVIKKEGDKILSKDDKFLKKVKDNIEGNILKPDFNVSKLAENLNIGTTQLYRKIKALTGHTSVEFVNILRLVKAAELLETQDYSVKEVSYMTGFNSPSYFVKCFREKYNITPVNYQKDRLKG